MPAFVTTLRDLLLLAMVVVFIIDVSGFKETLLRLFSALYKHEVTSMRPFTCSLCMTWWTGLIWLIASGSFSLPGLAALAVVASLTKPIAGYFIFIIQGLQALADKLMDWIGL